MAPAAAIAAWGRRQKVRFEAGDKCMYYAPAPNCPQNGYDASEQSSGRRQSEQQPRADMSCLDGPALLLSRNEPTTGSKL
jgi:hypothetical protein